MKIQIHNPGSLPTIDYRSIKPLQGNLKDFHKDEYEKLGNSFKEFGFRFPFFVWFDSHRTPWTIDGHGRLRYFTNENVTNQDNGYEFPYVSIEAKDKIEAKKLLLVATSQYQKITQEGLDEFSFDLPENFVSDFTHFDGVFEYPEDEEEPEAKEDDFEEAPPEKPVTVLGDLYELHSLDFGLVHRIQCGDSTNDGDVGMLLKDVKPVLFSDPPYGINVVNVSVRGDKPFGAVGASNIVKANKYSPIKNDNSTDTAKDSYNLALKMGIGKMLIWGGNYFTDFLPPSKGWIIWDKKGRKWEDNFSDFEMAWTSLNVPAKIFTHVFMGMVQEGEREKRVHPTQKPVPLIANIISKFFNEDLFFYDPFLGSGTTLIATEQLERNCYGQELDEKYMDVIVRRWTKYMIENNRKFIIKKNDKELQGEELAPFLPVVSV